MYVTRLDAWGVEKNCTRKRLSSLLHQTEDKDSLGTISTLGNAGKGVDRRRIEKYLKRTKKDVEMPLVAEEQIPVTPTVKSSPLGLGSADPQSPDTDSTPTNLQHPPFVQDSRSDGEYESKCLFRQYRNRFRLIENFPKYNTCENLVFTWLTAF